MVILLQDIEETFLDVYLAGDEMFSTLQAG